MLDRSDYLYFTDRALDGMAATVRELGDDHVNRRAYGHANTPYAVLHHCLCVVEAWAGGFVRGRPITRDRDAEFTAAGDVAELVERTAAVRRQLHLDVLAADPGQPLRHEPPADFLGPPVRLTQGAALQHVFEELAQHHGQLQILRDVLLLTPADQPTPANQPAPIRQPTPIGQPAPTDLPAPADQPAPTGSPAAVDLPAPVGRPAVADQPASDRVVGA